MESVLFYLFAAVAVASAIYVVAARNPLHSALSLIGTFVALAGVYALLSAHLLAAIQVLVYAGAVMVLFIFVIMLLNLKDEELGEPRPLPMKFLGAGALVLAGGWLSVRVLGAVGERTFPVPVATPEFGTVAAVGRAIYSSYLLPFEVTGVLLLVAIVAAVVVAKARI
jgi:NADH-quinone oxidoreductase subunit J